MSAVPKTRLAKQFALINQISFPSNRSAAVKFSPQLAKVELIFKKKNYGGHMGLRKFWQTYLPTLKFYNEELQFSVKRISLSEGVKDKEKALQLETDRELVEKCPSKIVLQYGMLSFYRETEVSLSYSCSDAVPSLWTIAFWVWFY